MQKGYNGADVGRQPIAPLLLLAEQIDNGLCIAEDLVPEVAARCIHFYEQPFAETRDHRHLAARAAAKLAAHSSIALDLVIESALRYAAQMKELDDGDPYSPNALEVLAAVPYSEKVCSVLKQIISDYPGMAQGDAVSALAALGDGGW
jgi:hypothetical protein